MKRSEILEELQRQNPWWQNKETELNERIIQRKLKTQIKKELENSKISGVIGLRRTGKTTLLKLLIKDLLTNTKGKRICYFSYDLAEELNPRKIIKIYTEEILKEPLNNLKNRIYLFFDEIQKVEDWGNQIKSIHDKNYNIKFVVSGSSSMNITKGAGESLVGRIIIHELNPFTFSEFLKYRGVKHQKLNLKTLKYPNNSEELRIHFNEYFELGGIPEIYEDLSIDYLRQMLDLLFFRDIIEMFEVKKSSVLKGIFRIISEKTGQKINYSNISNNLDTQYRTIKNYIEYLEDSFLIKESPPYENNTAKSLRKNPKVYISDHSYNNIWKTKNGLKAETIAFNHLKRIEKPYYNNSPEIDIVLPKKKYGFEIKYTDKITKKDSKSLTELPKEFKLFLVTKDKYDKWYIENRKINLIPLWMLCTSI